MFRQLLLVVLAVTLVTGRPDKLDAELKAAMEAKAFMEAKAAMEAIARSTVLIDAQMLPIGLKQNAAKAEHVATFLGPGQTKETHLLKDLFDGAAMGDLR